MNKGEGKTGLMNIGNTCFLNSCVQIINHIYELNDTYKTTFQKHKKEGTPETEFFKEWISLHDLMWEKNGIICPHRFVQSVHELAVKKNRELFTGFGQNDIHEFIHLFIETIHTSISRKIEIEITGNPTTAMDEMAVKCYNYLQIVYKNEFSEILKLFYGMYMSNITSFDGNTIYSTIPETFFILDLPIPGEMNAFPPSKHTIYDCLDIFVKEEIMEGDNAWFNESTGKKENIRKKTAFWNFPKILVISFNRFSPCGRWKRNDMIDSPLVSLDLSPYVCGYNPQKYKYDLFGVCNHFGNRGGGHYTAFVLNYLDEWIHFNDGNIEMNPSPIVTPASYCLFYRLQN
jgi:ubiquitin carboxyl-terminal hydrolase 8